jgi:hypothetical protein
MGSWGTDLLENDSASDAIGDLVAELAAAAAAAAAGPPMDEAGAARFCARLAVILHYEPWFFDTDSEASRPREALRGVVRENRLILDKVAVGAKPLLAAIADGAAVGKKPALGGLLLDRRVRPTLQKIADNLVENIEDDLESQEAGAYLDVLALLAPHVELPGKTVRHWRRRMRDIVADLDDEEAEMFRAYAKVLEVLVNSLHEDEDDEEAARDDEDDEAY